MAILLSISAFSQVDIQIGNGTAYYYDPLPGWYGWNRSAYLYKSNEINTGGVINSVAFQIQQASTGTTAKIKIYLLETSMTAMPTLAATNWNALKTGATLVYQSNAFAGSPTGWKTIQLDLPFAYSGVDNLMVLVEGEGCTTGGGCTSQCYNHDSPATHWYLRKDTSAPDDNAGSTSLTGYEAKRANIILNISPLGDYCYPPNTLAASNVTSNSADFAWVTHVTGLSWIVQYKTASDTTWSSDNIVYTGAYNLQGLTPYTTYNFRVKSICATNESGWNTINFTTLCVPINTLPLSESFDTYGTGSSTYPSCWYKLTNNEYPYISTTNYSAPGSMYMYAASGAYNYVISPAFDSSIPINTLSAFFKLYKTTASYNVTVGVMSDPTNMATFDSITNLTPTALSSWQIFSVNFANYTGTGHHIAFKVQGFGATNVMYMDELVIRTTPTCNIPTGLTKTASTFNSMDLDWNAADDANCSGWIVEYKPYDDQVWLSEYTTSHPFTISNLVSNVVYRISVKAVCVSGDTTLATDIVNYGLPCGPISYFPWEEGFEDVWFTGNGYGGTADSRPWCWYNVNGGASATYKWQRTTTASYVRSGLASMQMYTGSTTSQLGDWIISPVFTFTGNERIKFWAKGYSTYTDRLTVKIYDVSTNTIFDAAADTSLFVTILPNTVIPAATWTQYEINLSQYVGDYQIAFVRNTTGGYYLNIDDITIDAIPACPDISQLSVLSTTASTVTLNWTYTTNANLGFEISYANVNTGFDPNTGTIINVPDGTTLPYVVSNLTPGQFYSFAVRQACGGNWSNIIVTNTDGLPATLPYNCDFSDVNEQASWKISNGNATNKFYIGTPSNVIAPISGTNLYISSDLGVTNSYNTSNIGTAITSRLIEFDGSGGYRLNFDLYIGGESSYDYVKVFLTDPDTNFVGDNTKPYYAINSYAGNNQLLNNYNNTAPYFNGYNATTSSIVAGSYPREIVLPYQGPAGTVKRLIFLWANDGGGGTQPPASIDNIVLEALTCPIPTNIATANLTTTSSDIVWTDPSGTATEWIVKWKPTTDTTWNIASSNATTYSLTNLTINTAYNVRIGTVCGSDTSVYATFYFATPCVDITIPYTQNFDAASGFPTCWTRKVGASNPTSSTSYLVSSPYSLYFYASSTYQYAATPPVDINVAMNTLQVSFKMYRSTASYVGVKVGIMTDPNNMATFEQIGSIVTTTQLSTWEDKTVLLNNYTGTGRYIAFICDGQTAANGFYIDNLEIAVIPTCPRPTQLTVANIQANSVELNWLENGIATTWNIEYGPTGFTQGSGTLLTGITIKPYLLGGLTPQTTYQFYVQADCGGSDLSLWSSVKSFTTACLPVTTVPYTENFDTYGSASGVFPSCWFRPILYSSNPSYPSIVTAYSVSSPASLRFQSAAADQPTYAITPQLDVDINTLRVQFKLKAESTTNSGTMHVGVMSDPSNPTTFELVQIITPTSTSFTEYEISFANTTLTGTGKYIAFKHVTSSSAWYYWLDDVVVDLIPSCPKPLALTASTTDVSATLSWTEQGSATEWEVQYDTANFVFGQGQTILAYDTFATIASLTSNTSYKFYVRSICSIGDSSLWSGPYTFKTQVLNPIPSMEPFLTTTTPTGYNITGWTIGSTRGVTGNPGNNIYKNLYSSATTGQFTTANFGPVQSNTVLNFDYKVSLYDSPYGPVPANSGNFIVAVSTDWGNTYFNVDTIENNGLTGYQAYSLNLSTYLSQNVKIKIIGNWASEDYDIGIDNIYVGPVITCFNPSTLSVNTVTINSANLNWIDSVNTGTWNIQYGPTGFTLGNGTIISNISASPYNLINLTPATTYQFYVQADCGGGDLSLWAGPYSFTTHCLPVTTIPYTENFDTYGTTAGTFPSCWFRPVLSGTTPFPSIVTSNIVSSPASLKFQSPSSSIPTYAITPQLDVNINTLRVLFKLKAESTTYSGTMQIGVMSNPSDTSTFELVQIITPTSTNYTNYEISFANTTLTGTGKYIAFKHVTSSSSWFYWLDDVVVDLIPSCPRPTNLISSNSTQSSTTLSWTETGSATSWNIEYGPVGFVQGNGTVVSGVTNQYILSALTPASCFDFYVQAVCSPTDISIWSQKGSFCTSQVPLNVPFTVDFETPSGFQIVNNPSRNKWYIGSDTANTVNHTTGGQNALYVSKNNGITNAYSLDSASVVWAYRDVYFTPSTADYTLSFDWKNNGEGTGVYFHDYLSVYIGTPNVPIPSTTSTITPPVGSDTIVARLRLQPTWQTSTDTLPSATYSGQTKRIYFMWANDGSLGTQPPAAVDNISITSTGISTCLPPTNVIASNISSNAATITWTAGGTETEWELDYKLNSASTWTTVIVTSIPSHILGSLQPNSSYDVRVRAKCNATTYSSYSAIWTFSTTATPCLAPTNVAASNITDNSTTITWTPGGSETSWQVEYKISTSTNWTIPAAVSTPSIFLQGLQSNTTYNVRVKALCNPGESAFASAQFTTTGGVIPFTIIASASGPGTITPSGNVQVLPGASQLFTFTPNTGCEVSTLLIDNVNIPNPGLSHNFTNVTADHTIQVTFVTVGIEEGNLAQMVQLYPNPTNATIEIRMNETQLQVKECRVYDIYGKLMSIVPVNADNTKIDATDFAAGVYFIRMNSEMGVITKKFVKK